MAADRAGGTPSFTRYARTHFELLVARAMASVAPGPFAIEKAKACAAGARMLVDLRVRARAGCYIVSFCGDIRRHFADAGQIAVRPGETLPWRLGHLSDELLPRLSPADIEAEGRALSARLCRGMRRLPVRPAGMLAGEALHCIQALLPGDGRVLGMIALLPCALGGRTLPAGTLVVDPRASAASRRVTVLHEWVHWHYHQAAACLARDQGCGAASRFRRRAAPMDAAEFQAEGIALAALMPRDDLAAQINARSRALYARRKARAPGVPLGRRQMIGCLLPELAAHYGADPRDVLARLAMLGVAGLSRRVKPALGRCGLRCRRHSYPVTVRFNYDGKPVSGQTAAIAKDRREIARLAGTLSGYIWDVLPRLMAWREMNDGELAEASWVSADYIHQLCNEKKMRRRGRIRVGSEVAVKLAIGLRLPRRLVTPFLSACGVRLMADDPLEGWYHDFLFEFSGLSVADCNAILKAAGLKPFRESA